ncbi:hypothetical protein V1517DRAFT_337094 [Lipomyces orientalis]|uniref:Uncharacterized protein n=1 Tax=Lipomyces orientalis TaxID=1233043 RepID=A0ACC3TVS9_9ASCO
MGFASDTLARTTTGLKRVGDIQIGDILYDAQNCQTPCIGVAPPATGPLRKITYKDFNSRILSDYFYQDLVRGDINHPEPTAVHAYIDTVLKQKYYPGHEDEYSERIDEYIKVAHASVLDREAIDAIHAGMDRYLEWMASMDTYLEQLSTRRAEAEEVDCTDEECDIDEPTKLTGDPTAPGPEYSFPQTPFVEWDLPSSQSSHSYIPSSQLPQPDDDPQPDDSPRSSSPLSDSSSTELDNTAADRFAAIRKSLDCINCDCGGLRSVYRRFKTEELAQLALKILRSDHHHLIDPLIVRDGEVFSMTDEEFERLCHEQVKGKRLKLYSAPLAFDSTTVSAGPRPLDPFFLGLWFGDGTANRAEIASSDPETRVWLQSYVDRLNSSRSPDDKLRLTKMLGTPAGTVLSNGYVTNSDVFRYMIARQQLGPGKTNNPVLDGLRELGILGDKSGGIPDAYMEADEDTRLAVIAGLIDSDGTYCKVTNRYRFVQMTEGHKQIVYDLKKLAEGCGISVSDVHEAMITTALTKGRPTPTPAYTVYLTKGSEKFQKHLLLPRKKMNLEHTYINHDSRPFTVSDAPAGEYRAIQGYAQNLFVPRGQYGVADPAAVKQLSEVIGNRKLVYLASTAGGLTSDMRKIMQTVTSGLPASQVIELNDPVDLLTVCKQNLRGSSTCYSAVEWHSFDFENRVYNYSLRADAGLGIVNVPDHTSDSERYLLPLQWAVDATLTGLSVLDDVPLSLPYTSRSEEQHRQDIRVNYMNAVINYISPAMYLAMIGVVYHITGRVASEREHGLSTLLESMGCRKAARHLSFFLAFSTLYVVGWIVVGVAVGISLFKTSNLGTVIVFHILNGIANVSWSLVLAQPWKQTQLAGIMSTGVCILLAIMAVIQRAVGPHNGATSGVLGFIFPPMGYVFYIQENARYERATMALSLMHVPPEGYTAPGIYWIGAVWQTVAYFFLGMAFERVLYGKQRRTTSGSEHDEYALTLTHVTKTFRLFTFLGVFMQSKRLPPVEAVKDLSVSFRTGELTCLLGANGSGKTTTLEMIAGIQNPTSGTMTFGSSTELGICPQKNVMWDDLTVEENVRIWARIKAIRGAVASDINAEVEDLICACDLSSKKKYLSKNLSGGQRRKLQLTATFAGGSKVCCVDEVSSGLDPLSRRRIWDILLASRGERTIILTTHFLDEADLLADNIAVLAKGVLTGSGSPMKLKEDFGNGYRVFSITPASGKEMVYEVKNGSQVIALVSRLEREGHKELRVSGPQLEDVFLKFAADSDPEIQELLKANDAVYLGDDDVSKDAALAFEEVSSELDLKVGRIVGLWGKAAAFLSLVALRQELTVVTGQIWTMTRKRLIVTRRHPFPMFCVVLIPILVGGIVSRFVRSYEGASCNIVNTVDDQEYDSFTLSASADSYDMIFGPQSTVMEYLPGVSNFLAVSAKHFSNFTDAVHTNFSTLVPGGIYLGSPVTLTYRVNGGSKLAAAGAGIIFGPIVLNMLNNIRANGTATIITNYSPFQYPWVPGTGDSLQFIVYICLAMGAYPAFCSLYPTMERLHRVRALHYSNGLGVLPLWISYLLYDSCFALLATVIVTGILASANSNWFGLGYLFVVMFLYGFTSILLAFVVSLISKSQLAAFAITAAYQCCYFLVYLIAYLSVNTFVTASEVDRTLSILYYVMGLFAPIANLIKALFLSLNLFSSMCNGDTAYSYYGDIGAYGAPILYLVLQAAILFGVLIWWDSGLFRLRVKRKFRIPDAEDKVAPPDVDLVSEIQRVESPQNSDGLRVMHLSKQFGKFVAVEDVSFGVARGECFALLGPNGAGKSTTFDMIRGEIVPSGGNVFVEDVSVSSNRAHARTHLGVCLQFDAIDQMNVDETLSFYARLRGLEGANVQHNVEEIVHAVGLSRFRTRMAAKLSGGNRRKLSLGIALMANPKVLLLDEPSSGLDAASKRVMWRTLAHVASGRSIVLTTPSMEEADALASRAGILAKNLRAVGSSDRLRERYGDFYYIQIIHVDGMISTEEAMRQIVNWARDKFVGHTVRVEGIIYHGQVKLAVQTQGEQRKLTSCRSSVL